MDRVDCLIVGAGVVGLASARALAQAGHEVVVVESAGSFGTGVSSRSSEVIHAGLYYEAHSLKARLSVRGKALLYDYCEAKAVPFDRTGKLIVATSAGDLPQLRALLDRARSNDVMDLVPLTPDQAKGFEPELTCAAALLSPSSGIVDSHALMTALLADAEAAGASLAVASPFVGATPSQGRWICRTGGDAEFEIESRWLVNCAGLRAQSVARTIDTFPVEAIPAQHLAKGHYFSLAARAPFARLIYPLPSDGGLGVHLTLDLGGQARFGPDVEWLPEGLDVDDLDFRVDAARAGSFYAEIRRYWPALPDGALQPAYSGIRPKLSGPGRPAADFRIDGPEAHGCPGLVQLFGIESPGLTASMAIAEEVASIVCRDRDTARS